MSRLDRGGVIVKVYNKLIRDNIPEIIDMDGKKSNIKVLDNDEYLKSLNSKLQEELDEYYEDGNIKELADLVEVIYAILNHKEVSIEEFEKIRLNKKITRGGFDKKLFLVSVED